MDKKNILLVCGGGASSGFMAQNIRKAAKKQKIDLDVSARSESEIDEFINDIDVLLVGPHLSYMENEIKEKVEPHNIPYAIIDQSIYGLLDGNRGLALILQLLEQKK